MKIRRITATALLALGTFVPSAVAFAQVDTIASRPLFTRNDLWLTAGFVGLTVAAAPFDKHYAERLQDPNNQSNKFYGDVATVVRNVADPGSIIIGVGMYGIGRLAHVPRMADLGLHGTEAVLIGSVIGTAIKGTVGRARPYVADTTGGTFDPHDFKLFRGFTKGSEYQSFPSGHTIAAFAAAAAVSNETSRWWPRSRWVIGPAMYGGAALVGLSRMYNNRHWASDVLLGAAIGTFAGNKVVRYHHSHPGNRLDKWLLSASVMPTDHGWALGMSVLPGIGSN